MSMVDEYYELRASNPNLIHPLIDGFNRWWHGRVAVYWTVYKATDDACDVYVALLDALVEARIELARKRVKCPREIILPDEDAVDRTMFKVLFDDYGGAREVAEALAHLVQEAQAQASIQG